MPIPLFNLPFIYLNLPCSSCTHNPRIYAIPQPTHITHAHTPHEHLHDNLPLHTPPATPSYFFFSFSKSFHSHLSLFSAFHLHKLKTRPHSILHYTRIFLPLGLPCFCPSLSPTILYVLFLTPSSLTPLTAIPTYTFNPSFQLFHYDLTLLSSLFPSHHYHHLH